MNTIASPNIIKRHIYYVDEKVQKGLLIALLTIEVLLIAGTLWMLYLQMGNVVEDRLYRVHLSDRADIYLPLLKTVLISLTGMVVINILMLWIASWVWERHVNSILKPFRELVGKVESLDFSKDAAINVSHKVVDLALAWRYTKRQRLLKLREEVTKLGELGDLSSAEARCQARSSLEAIRELLPR
ncbi:MAG: hypothetical protein OEV15_09215 [Gallionella sp.]|nr:hypothetical protein [Gallionella sp.]